MAWDGMPKVGALLTQAGAAMANPIVLIARGAPKSLPDAMIRYWYEGTGLAPGSVGAVGGLADTDEGIRIQVGIYLPNPGGELDAEIALDLRLEDAEDHVRTALWSDFKLSGSAFHLEAGESYVGEVMLSGLPGLACLLPLVYSVGDRHAIS